MTARGANITRDCACRRARHQHGTRAAYAIDKCRCFRCRVAHANSTRAYRAGGSWPENRLVDATGTRRRLEALATLGVGNRAVGELLGVSPDGVSKFRTAPNRISVDSAARVRAVYDALWDKPITDAAGRRVKAYADAQGWLPPMAWDDDTIDDPAAEPQHRVQAPGWELKPCGTHAAVRRHQRHGEKLCDACRNADRRYRAERGAA